MTAVPRYAAVLFDLLTGLEDSWTVWDRAAGDASTGRRWRAEYLRLTYGAGAYQPYLDLVARAATNLGLPATFADRLADHWREIKPWPEAPAVLRRLKSHCPIGVVTNCSIVLGNQAIAAVGVDFDVTVIAEVAGFYKPDRRTYQAALTQLDLAAERALFVAGSAWDIAGAANVGLPVVWHNRIGAPLPPGSPPPLAEWRTLDPLVEFVFGSAREAGRP